MLELRKRADKTGDEPSPGDPWPLRHVELVGEAPDEHNFADTFVSRALAEGWLEFKNLRAVFTEASDKPYSRGLVLTGDEIVLHLETGDLTYEVLEHPGRYETDEEGVIEHHEYRCRKVSNG